MPGQNRNGRKRVLMISNPAAGRFNRRRCGKFLERLQYLGCDVSSNETTKRGDAERIIMDTKAKDFDVIAVAGGDGTIGEVLNGLGHDRRPIAILPVGTANVLAREIGLPRSVDDIAKTVVFGPSRPISLGEANGRRFVVMASVGLDANVVERVNLKLKRHIGKLAYLYETVKQILWRSPITYRLRVGNETQEASGVIIANGRHYAGPFIAAPEANLEMPKLDVCRMTRRSRLAGASYFLSMATHRLEQRDDYVIASATSLEILGPRGQPVQADGDFLCRLPAIFRILPNAADLVFPPDQYAAKPFLPKQAAR